jgi:hypothetical protein
MSNFSQTNYITSWLNDCSRKYQANGLEDRESIDLLDVLKEWTITNGTPKTVMRDNAVAHI